MSDFDVEIGYSVRVMTKFCFIKYEQILFEIVI